MKLYILKKAQKWYKLPIYKIGITGNTPQDRIDNIKLTGNIESRLIAEYKLFFAYPIEQFLHRRLKKHKRTQRGSGKTEWFRISVFAVFLLRAFLFAVELVQVVLIVILLFFILIILQTT